MKVLGEPDRAFEALYLEARRREGWVYSDEEVARLPLGPARHEEVWRMRAGSARRWLAYARARLAGASVLEVGCGNGWFAAAIAREVPGARVVGIDACAQEVAQASRVFAGAGVEWWCGDPLAVSLPAFDVVVLNGAIQYFAEIGALFRAVAGWRELHVLDSPFYPSAREAAAARERSARHYAALGVPEMAGRYHPHEVGEIARWRPSWLHDPRRWRVRVARRLGVAVSPFPWLRFRPVSG